MKMIFSPFIQKRKMKHSIATGNFYFEVEKGKGRFNMVVLFVN